MEKREQKSSNEIPPFEGVSAPPTLDPQSRKALLQAFLIKYRQNPSEPALENPVSQKAERQKEDPERGTKADVPLVSGKNPCSESSPNLETTEDRDERIGTVALLPPTQHFYTPEQMYQALITRIAAVGRVTQVSSTLSSGHANQPDSGISVANKRRTDRMHDLLQGQIKMRPDHKLFYCFYTILFEKPNPISFGRRGPLRKEVLILILLTVALLVLFIIFNWKALLEAGEQFSKR